MKDSDDFKSMVRDLSEKFRDWRLTNPDVTENLSLYECVLLWCQNDKSLVNFMLATNKNNYITNGRIILVHILHPYLEEIPRNVENDNLDEFYYYFRQANSVFKKNNPHHSLDGLYEEILNQGYLNDPPTYSNFSKYDILIQNELDSIFKISPEIGTLSLALINSIISSQSKTIQKQKKQDLELQEKEAQIRQLDAKTAQELAIAKRIIQSEKVEIEEYFESEGEGSLGVTTKKQSASVGASVQGNKVTKRIIRFHGLKKLIS